jgi:hypothetical protein
MHREVIVIDFVPFPKLPRLRRDIVVTEKIDGTNAQVCVLDDGTVLAGSRTRWVTPEDDNFGFAAWVREHEAELRDGLGVGHHFGEWWGSGIQMKYGLDHRRFSLFNTTRWAGGGYPDCCHVVPVLYDGPFDMAEIQRCADELHRDGSVAAPGFPKAEGVVVFHVAANKAFKYTPYHKCDGHKG